jgi:hypothetical protein
MIWFAIIWLVAGSLAAILFGIMARQSQVPAGTLGKKPEADGAQHKNHVPAHY